MFMPADTRARVSAVLVLFLTVVLISTTTAASASAAPGSTNQNRVKAFNAAVSNAVGAGSHIAPGQGRGEGLPQPSVAEGRGVHTYDVLAAATPVLVHNTSCPIPWSSSRIGSAAGQLERGAGSVTVASRSEAEELFLRLYQGAGYRNTTGMSGREMREFFGSKAGTYHWDTEMTPGLPHSGSPHLQIHSREGDITRIFYGGERRAN